VHSPESDHEENLIGPVDDLPKLIYEDSPFVFNCRELNPGRNEMFRGHLRYMNLRDFPKAVGTLQSEVEYCNRLSDLDMHPFEVSVLPTLGKIIRFASNN
jgi:hypothetical protein